MKRINLGKLLIDANLINQEQLELAIEQQKKSGEKLGRTLLNMHFIKEKQLLTLLAKQLNLPYIDLTNYDIDQSLSAYLPEIYARQHRAIILDKKDNEILIGMSDPLDINAVDAITRILKQPINIAVISEHALLLILDRIYRRTQEISHFAKELSSEIVEETSSSQDELFGENINTEEQATVEYSMERIIQVQVNAKIDLSFSKVLRAILRQDPDVIMVGEIRDAETARIAMRAAVTGHFVLATVHTNDAITSAIRLIDMGAEGYMVGTAVKAIVGQRLVRLLCQSCIQDHIPDANEIAWLASVGVISPEIKFKTARGCSYCSKRGFISRKGIYELLELNSDMLNALRLNNAAQFTKAAFACESYKPLAKSVLSLVLTGETSISEAIRVIGYLDEEFIRYHASDFEPRKMVS